MRNVLKNYKNVKLIGSGNVKNHLKQTGQYEYIDLNDYKKLNREEKRKIGWIVVFNTLHQYKECRASLEQDTLQYLHDFYPFFLFESEIIEQEYIVFIGECQLADIAEMLKNKQQQFDVCFIDARFLSSSEEDHFIFHLCKNAKYIIKNNYPKVKMQISQYDIDEHKVINIPFFSFWGMWPQVEQVVEKRNPFNYFAKDDKGPFPVADVNINNAILRNEKLEVVIENVMCGNYVKELNVNAYYEKTVRLFELMTYDDDDEIKREFLKLVKEQNSMRDPTHLQPSLINEMVTLLARRMECKLSDELEVQNSYYNNPCTEMIIYPKIAEMLQLNWTHNYKYAVREGISKPLVYLGIEDWIRCYFEYCRFTYKNGENKNER